MEYVKIGDTEYDVSVVAVVENFNILYTENTSRTVAVGARMFLDPLGTFYGHKVTFKRKHGKENEFDDLFMYISKPRRDGIPVKIVHNQKTLDYEAYISQGERNLKKIDLINKKVYWDEFTVDIIPMEAQVLPE